MDGTQDCIDGTDEDITIWEKSCGKGANKKFIPNQYDCNIFTKFICYKSDDQIDISSVCRKSVSISANKTVHKTTKCESEERACQESKDLPRVLARATKRRQDNSRFHLLHCLPGLETLHMALGGCEEQVFRSKNYPIHGVPDKKIVYPISKKHDCRHTFGENYVYLACSGLCRSSVCPLVPVTRDDCSGNIPQRTFALARNSYLTVVTPTGTNYSADFFACKNKNCVTYDKVCDLIDDCNDGSDEVNCSNHFECENSGEYIVLTKVCDGKLDCFDSTDECNAMCTKHVIDGPAVLGWLAGVFGIVILITNGVVMYSVISKVRKFTKTRKAVNEIMILTIAIGDLIVGLYLIVIFGYNIH